MDADRPPASPAGVLITFEGGEGSGKSTQVERLATWLREQGRAVVTACEPGTTATGEFVRGFLLETAPENLAPEAELALYLAARAQLVAEIVRPAMADGNVVLLDRFGDSSVVYQGYGRGIDPLDVGRLNDVLTRGLKPALTVLIDVPVTAGLGRPRNRPPDRLERAGEPFHERVRAGYLELARNEPHRFCVLDGGMTIDAIQSAIRVRVTTLLGSQTLERMETE